MRKKISLVLPSLTGGGAERVNIDLAYEFIKSHDVDIVVCNAAGSFINEARYSFNVVDLQAFRKWEIIISLAKYIDKEKPDYLIISMWGLTALAPFAKLLAKHKPQILLVEHNSLINQFKHSSFSLGIYLKISTFIAYRLADFLGGVSLGVTQDMRSLALLKDRKVEVLYNPIPEKMAHDSQEKLTNFWDDCNYKILNVGSFKDQKNQKLLIKSFSMVNKQLGAKLIILGQGALAEELSGLIYKLGLEESVLLHDFVKDPSFFFLTADLFVLSSDREGFGNVIVEALSCGTPVVSTDCEHGPSEILNNGEFGTLVPVGNAQELAVAIEQSLTKSHDKQKLINRAKDFAPEISAKRYLKVLGIEK